MFAVLTATPGAYDSSAFRNADTLNEKFKSLQTIHSTLAHNLFLLTPVLCKNYRTKKILKLAKLELDFHTVQEIIIATQKSSPKRN